MLFFTANSPFFFCGFVHSCFKQLNKFAEAVLELDLAPKFSRKSNAPYFVVRSKDKHGRPLKRGGLPVVAQLANLEDVPAELEGVLERLADTDDKEALLLALAHSKGVLRMLV